MNAKQINKLCGFSGYRMDPSWIGYRMYDPAVGFVWSDGSSVSS